MTRLIFIRYAATDCFQDRRAGCDPDVHLNAAGIFRATAGRMGCSSRGSAESIAVLNQGRAKLLSSWRSFLVKPSTSHRRYEINYGAWTGDTEDARPVPLQQHRRVR
jgi:hypothetical protein